jgi:hypothetical protein
MVNVGAEIILQTQASAHRFEFWSNIAKSLQTNNYEMLSAVHVGTPFTASPLLHKFLR